MNQKKQFVAQEGFTFWCPNYAVCHYTDEKQSTYYDKIGGMS